MLPWRLTVKTLCEPGAADDDARSPNHWTFWRREALAYESVLLPNNNHGLDSVECFGVFSDDRHEGGVAVALDTVDADAIWDLDQFAKAAGLLGQWQAGWARRVPPVEWLAQDQLGQRIGQTEANGGLVQPDWSRPALAAAFPQERQGQLQAVWERRWAWLERLASGSSTLTHGDFSRGNLFAGGDGRVVVIDWAALGLAPAGFDLAHLVLSALNDMGGSASVEDVQTTLVGEYLSAFDPRLHDEVRRAFAVTAALTATSRLCWTLTRTVEPAAVEHWARLVPWIVASGHAAGSA